MGKYYMGKYYHNGLLRRRVNWKDWFASELLFRLTVDEFAYFDQKSFDLVFALTYFSTLLRLDTSIKPNHP